MNILLNRSKVLGRNQRHPAGEVTFTDRRLRTRGATTHRDRAGFPNKFGVRATMDMRIMR